MSTIGIPLLVKQRAGAAVSKAKAEGTLIPLSACQRCGSTSSIVAHHPDYSKPLDVEWLCRSCHRYEHGNTPSYMPETGGDIRVTLALTTKQHEWLYEQANKEDRSIASLIRQLVERARRAK